MSLQCLEHTPSVYFNFDDASNKNSNTNEFLFELSCTNQKPLVNLMTHIDPSVLDLGQSVEKPLLDRLRTQEFFQQFDSHFVVTFEEVNKESFKALASTAHQPFQKQNIDLNINCQKQISQVFLQSDFSLEQPLHKESSQFDIKQHIMPTTTSFIREQVEECKERQSPIPAFEVKKRTVFKSKQNISNNPQIFKITKKKLVNQNTFEKFMSYPKSDKLTHKSNQIYPSDCLTSKIREKPILQTKVQVENLHQNLSKKIMVKRKSKSTIFQCQAKGCRQPFRSITLDNWRRKFNLHKKSVQQTIKRTNIFQKPFSLF